MANKLMIHYVNEKAIIDLEKVLDEKLDIFYLKIKLFGDLYKKYGVKVAVLYEGTAIIKDITKIRLEKEGILFYSYLSEEDLNDRLDLLRDLYDICYVDATSEIFVQKVIDTKKYLGISVGKNSDLFRNKFLQRELIQKDSPDLGIKYRKGKIYDYTFEGLSLYLGLPFIIKPINGIESSGVVKIEKKSDYLDYKKNYDILSGVFEDRGYQNIGLIFEEYVDGKMYSIDYYVDSNGSVNLTKPVEVILGKDIGIDDFSNIVRMLTTNTEKLFKNKNLDDYVRKIVKITDIKNTFVHHEFKINSKGEIKTIEINGRIGGYRLDLFYSAFGFNMYEMIFDPNSNLGPILHNTASLSIYSVKKGIFKKFNENLFSRIAKLKSFTSAFLMSDHFGGKEVGLTKDGFQKLGNIKLESKDSKELIGDLNFVIENYTKLVILE